MTSFKRKLSIVLMLVIALVGVAAFCCWLFMVRMPGECYHGNLDRSSNKGISKADDELEPTNIPATAKSTSRRLQDDVEHLAGAIGERNLQHYDALQKSAKFVQDRLAGLGYEIRRESFQVRGLDCHNIEATKKGNRVPDEIVIVGAHYDSVFGTPGANDNASGTAAMLWLAETLAKQETDRTIRFIAFTNEEPPYFQTDEMGSYVYAKGCRNRNEKLVAVFSLETMGYYSDAPNSQKFPSAALAAMYPTEGNFIAFIGNIGSRPLVSRSIKSFREHAKFPSEGASLPAALPGIGWSDHWSFWQEGYQGIMITDTATFRYPHYHKKTDTPDKIDFDRLAIVVEGLEKVLLDFTNGEPK